MATAAKEQVATGQAGAVRAKRDESPLAWLHARGMVDARRFAAGERLRADWTRAGLGARVTMRWDAAPANRGGAAPGAGDATLGQIDAKRRFDVAIDAVGQGLADILWRVVCDGRGLEMSERELGWPARAGKVVLLIALDRLADHYRVTISAQKA